MDDSGPTCRATFAARVRRLILTTVTLLAVASCDRNSETQYTPSYAPTPNAATTTRPAAADYTFGIFPLHNPVRLFEVYQPMFDAINRGVPDVSVRLESSLDYASYDAKIVKRAFDFAIINPYQAVLAERRGYHIFGKMLGDEKLRGIIVVRKDSGVVNVSDLRGCVISFPAPTAFAATMMNKMFLHARGLNVEKEAIPHYVGSQDSSIMNVYTGQSRAGGIWPPTWDALQKERPDVVAALEVKWKTEPLVQLAVVARDDVPAQHVAKVAEVLFHLGTTEEGRSIVRPIGVPGFEPATIASYEPVIRFMADYERAFGALPSVESSPPATRPAPATVPNVSQQQQQSQPPQQTVANEGKG